MLVYVLVFSPTASLIGVYATPEKADKARHQQAHPEMFRIVERPVLGFGL